MTSIHDPISTTFWSQINLARGRRKKETARDSCIVYDTPVQGDKDSPFSHQQRQKEKDIEIADTWKTYEAIKKTTVCLNWYYFFSCLYGYDNKFSSVSYALLKDGSPWLPPFDDPRCCTLAGIWRPRCLAEILMSTRINAEQTTITTPPAQ